MKPKIPLVGSFATMSGPTTHLIVEGMTCSHCETTIRKYLESKSLQDVSVSFANEEVAFKSAEAELDEIVSGIERLGYKVVSSSKERHRFSAVEKRFAFTVPFTGALLSAMIVMWEPLHDPLVQMALCIPVLTIGLWHFGRSALGSLRAGAPNMDVLITLGASAAFGYSLWGTLAGLGPGYQFYETTASIITLVLLGNVIEHRSVRQTTSAIRELGKLQPQTAKVIYRQNGSEKVTEIAVERLAVGDTVQVNAGDLVPADGRILNGTALIDESMMSGESLPVSKSSGDDVVGGTLVEDGSVQVTVSRAGQNSTLARIIDMVKNARMHRAPMQKLADRISAVFVPIVIVIALATFLLSWLVADAGITRSLLNSVAVLVIACPCAMGLATPTAVAVGLGRSARRGILIRGVDTVEKLRRVKTIVFDKTGTLTTGDFQIQAIESFGVSDGEMKSILVGLEKHSSHPIGKAIVKGLLGTEPKPLGGIKETKGVGIEGKDDTGAYFRIGSARILATPATKAFDLYITRNDVLVGGVEIKDELKPDAHAVISDLNAKGYRTILLSGDRESKCKVVAEELGVTEYHSEQLPDQKLQIIKTLTEHAPTAMVGDGVNDAPALAQATVGISLGDATQVAIQSSEVILLGGRLSRLPEALIISKHTVSTVRQNLFWAFFYNVIAIPVAAVGLLSPMIAALSMAFSDVMVIGNSLRLKVKRIR